MRQGRRPVRGGILLALMLVVGACATNSSSTPVGSPIGSQSSAPASASASPTSTPTGKITITAPRGATMGGFAETQVTASADTPIQIVFRNQDQGIMHNV